MSKEIQGMKVVPMTPFPPRENPFNHDAYHMGVELGTNVTVMYENHPNVPAKYLIIVNTATGERLKVEMP